MLKALIWSKHTAISSCAITESSDTCCPLSLWYCSAAGGHSAGFRTSWVCVQHHATVATYNGVAICYSKFPPTVSKHCQHQHSAISKTIPAIWNTNNPSSCDIKVLFPQSSIMAVFVHNHSSLLSDVSPVLPTYKNHNFTKFTVLFSMVICP